MDEYRLVCKIAEIRSYIASDWPEIEERRRLYDTLAELERQLKEIRDGAQKDKPKKD